MDDPTIGRQCRVCKKTLLGKTYRKVVAGWTKAEQAKVAVTSECFCSKKCKEEYYERVIKGR